MDRCQRINLLPAMAAIRCRFAFTKRRRFQAILPTYISLLRMSFPRFELPDPAKPKASAEVGSGKTEAGFGMVRMEGRF